MRRARAAGTVIALLIAETLLLAGTASAQGPDQVGWWSEAQQAPSPLPVTTVTRDNLMVGNDPTGPNAVSAVRFTVPADVDGASVDPSTVPATLTLHVAANSAVGSPVVAACPVLANWQPATGGAWADKPNYSCSPSAAATFSAAGDTATFQLTPDLQRSGGLYDLALVPAPGKTDPFSVQFVPPGADALQLGVGASPPGTTGPTPAEEPAATPSALPDTSTAPTPDLGTPGLVSEPPLPLSPAPAATPATTPQATGGSPAFFPSGRVVKVSAKRAQRALALGLLGLLAAGLWWFGGQQARSPRLLGSLAEAKGEGSGDAGPALYLPSGGIGRFARPRTEPPPRL